MEMHPVFLYLDPYLIWFYRLSGSAELNFLLGTLALAVLSLLVGKFTSFLAARIVRRHYEKVTGEAKRYQELSIEALKAGDRPAYEGANKLANEAFGKSFYSQVALSATFVWPIFFVLAWMQHRFLEVGFPIPGTNWSLGFIGVFIPIYIAAYLIMKRLPRLHRFKGRLKYDALQAPNQESACRSSAP